MLAASNTRVLGSGRASARASVTFKAVKPTRPVQARASGRDQHDAFASSAFAAAAAALLLVSSPVSAAEVSINPIAMTADGNIFERLWNKVPKAQRVQGDDTYASDRKEGRTFASTKRPMEIITEQEAVAPEAFPNPAAGISSKPAVLAAAEGDEKRGASRGQFEGITGADRQRLIDEKSPAQSSRK